VLAPIQTRLERDVCQSPDPEVVAMLRKIATEPADCVQSELRMWRFHVGSREAIIWRTKPRATAESPWGVRGAIVDGRLVIEAPPSPPFWSELRDLSRLEPAAAQALLESLAVTGPHAPPGTVSWETMLTRAETQALAERYPRAGPIVRDHPPGFGRDDSGWHLRAYSFTPPRIVEGPSTFQCPVISRIELSVGKPGITLHPLDSKPLEDTVQGRPCR
jgi:hypothetical protein